MTENRTARALHEAAPVAASSAQPMLPGIIPAGPQPPARRPADDVTTETARECLRRIARDNPELLPARVLALALELLGEGSKVAAI